MSYVGNTYIVEAEILLTMDSANSVVRDGAIAISNGVITAVGPADEVRSQFPSSEVIQGRQRLLMPGLINTHTHLAMTLLRGWAEGVDLQGFLERVWAAEAAIMDPDAVAVGTALGALESVLAGTTTTLDMYLHPHAAHEGALRVGLRHICGPIFFDFSGPDGLEWSDRLTYARTWSQVLETHGGPEVPVFLMPHGTYTVSPERMAELAELAVELGARVHVHASENAAENSDVRTRYSATPIELLDQTGILKSHTVLGHGVWLSVSDLVTLGRSEGAVAHCPGSNLKLASGSADFYRMKDRVAVGLGTDGCSSSNDLDMWFVMRTAALLATTVQQSAAKVHAVDFVRAATIEAARALGMQDEIGSLEVGKRADFIRLDLDQAHLTPLHDIYALLVFAAGRGDVVDTYIDGRPIVVDRTLQTSDADAILRAAREKVRPLHD